MSLGPLAVMAPGRIGRLLIKNRLIRAATSETMATDQGEATDDLVRLYSDLALGGAGLIIQDTSMWSRAANTSHYSSASIMTAGSRRSPALPKQYIATMD